MPTARDALRAALDQRAAANHRGNDITLGAAIDMAYRDLAANGRSPGTVSWLDGQVRVLRRHWKDEMPLRLLTLEELQAFAKRRLREVSPASVRHHLRAVGRIQVLARRSGWPGAITARDVAVPTPPPPRPRAMPWRRVEALFRRVRRDSPADADVIELVGRTGVRRSEAAAVRTTDIDLRRGILHVAKGKRRPRTLPVTAALRPVLVRLVEGAGNDGHLVRGGAATVSRVFKRWRLRLGEPRCTAHSLRHSLGTALVERGTPISTAARILGHAPGSAQVTFRYLGPSEPELRRALDVL